MRAAGIDIGTNTVRLIIADVKEGKIDRIIYQSRKITRLGEGFVNSNNLSSEAIYRTVLALNKFKEELDDFFVNRLSAIATSAVREADNGSVFLEKCKEIGLDVEVIDGKKEAELIRLGVLSSLDIVGENIMIFDIGGGSTEFILDKKGEIAFESVKLGVVKLADLFDFKGKISDETVLEVKSVIEDFIGDLDFDADTLVATAGTPTTLAAIDMELENYDYRKVHGYKLGKKRIEEILEKLRNMTSEERKSVKGLEEGREDLIIPGILITLAVMEKSGVDELIVSDFGLREGIVIHAAGID